jgi:hypothetical protein
MKSPKSTRIYLIWKKWIVRYPKLDSMNFFHLGSLMSSSHFPCLKTHWIFRSLSFSPQIPNPTMLILAESDISDLGRVYPTGPGYHNSRTRPMVRYVWWVKYNWPGSDISDPEPVPRLWNLTESWICLIHQICPPYVRYIKPRTRAKFLESDVNIRLGQIYPIWQSIVKFGHQHMSALPAF